jgi:hypothetical protein
MATTPLYTSAELDALIAELKHAELALGFLRQLSQSNTSTLLSPS